MREILRYRSVVLLNSDYSILSFISLKRAMGLFFKGKVDVERSKEGKMHPALDFGIPTVVRMKPDNYIYVPFKRKNISPKKKRILLRDTYTCQYCDRDLNKKNATIDHVVPKSSPKYPGHIWTNVVACCVRCNNDKGPRTPEQAGIKLLRQPFIPNVHDLVLIDKPELLAEIESIKSQSVAR